MSTKCANCKLTNTVTAGIQTQAVNILVITEVMHQAKLLPAWRNLSHAS